MNNFVLSADKISKKFNSKKYVLKNIDFSISNSEIVAVTGHNGAGKSTLLRILAGIWNSTEGKINFNYNNSPIEKENYYKYISYVAPYLNLYEEFTPLEHLQIFAKIRAIEFNQKESEENLKRFKLFAFRNAQIRTFSSGMKQRMKFVLAMQNKSDILFMDEPTSNLDAEGFNTVKEYILEQQSLGCGIIIATNDENEKAISQRIIALEQVNNNF